MTSLASHGIIAFIFIRTKPRPNGKISVPIVESCRRAGQSSLMVDRSTGRRYLVPSHVTVAVKEIYHAFGLKRSEVPRRLD